MVSVSTKTDSTGGIDPPARAPTPPLGGSCKPSPRRTGSAAVWVAPAATQPAADAPPEAAPRATHLAAAPPSGGEGAGDGQPVAGPHPSGRRQAPRRMESAPGGLPSGGTKVVGRRSHTQLWVQRGCGWGSSGEVGRSDLAELWCGFRFLRAIRSLWPPRRVQRVDSSTLWQVEPQHFSRKRYSVLSQR